MFGEGERAAFLLILHVFVFVIVFVSEFVFVYVFVFVFLYQVDSQLRMLGEGERAAFLLAGVANSVGGAAVERSRKGPHAILCAIL